MVCCVAERSSNNQAPTSETAASVILNNVCALGDTWPWSLPLCARSQAKAMTQSGEGGAKPMAPGQGLGLSQGNFGPKYEQHVTSLQKQLEDATTRIEELRRSEESLKCVYCGRTWDASGGGAIRNAC